MFRIRDIDHLVLRVVDLEKVLRFYCDVLGCTVEKRQDEIGLVQLRAGRSLIDLVPVDGPLGRLGGAEPGQEARNLDHFCLRIEPFDLEQIRAHLLQQGVQVGPVESRYGAEGEGPSVYLDDPEGNVVELKGPPVGCRSPIDESDTGSPQRYQGSSFYDDAKVFDTYSRHRERPESANDTLERPLMRELLGDVRGMDVLDLGCGNAEFGRDLLAAGAASYLGIDGSQNMVAQAVLTLRATAGRVVRSELQDWQYPTAAFDRVCSRLVLHYVADLGALLREVHRSLRPGGRLVFSVEHPVITSHDMPSSDDAHADWIVDDYFRTGPRATHWMGAEVVKYHRTVEDHFLALRASGFQVDGVRESKPVRANFQTEETFLRRQRIPLFLFMSAHTL